MRSRKLILVSALTFISLVAGLTNVDSKPSAPGDDDHIQLPYVRLYPSQLEVPKQNFRERMLLKDDDGTVESRSIRSIGHAVKFRRPQGMWKLTGIIAYLGRTGYAEADEGFKIHVCDTTGKSLTSIWRAKSRIRAGKPQWYMVDTVAAELPDEFYVIVDLKRQADDRSIVYLGCDTSDPTVMPEVAEPGVPGIYALNQAGKWMIRAVLSGTGNRAEDLIDARIVPDQVLHAPKKPDLKAYRAPDRKLSWLKDLPPQAPDTGRLDISWDQKDVIVGIRYLGKQGSMIKAQAQSLTVDLPVTEKSVFEVSVMRSGYVPAVKQFTVTPGSKDTWSAELKMVSTEEEGISKL